MDQFYFNGKRSSSNFIDFRILNIKKISDDKSKENYTDYIVTFVKENRKNITEFEYEELKTWLLGTHDYRFFSITGLDCYYAKFLRLNKLQNRNSIDFKLRVLNNFCYSYIITDELVAKNNTYKRNVHNYGIVSSDCHIYIEVKEDCDSLILKNTTNNNKIELNDLKAGNIVKLFNGFSLETGVNEVELKVDGGRADVVINRQDRLEFKELEKYYDETVDIVR